MENRLSAEERLLDQAVRTGRLAQAYLISSAGASSAHDAAESFIKKIFCEHKTACGVCLECRKFEEGNQVDFLRIRGEGIIKLEQVRQIPEFMQKKSFGGGKKCIYIEDAHEMNMQSQNYLLKSIEEPEDDVLFVLSTDQPEKLLPTILSRCIWIRLRPLPRRTLRRRLEGKIPEDRLETAIALSGGSPAEAVRIASDAELAEIEKDAAEICRNLAVKKNPSVFEMEKTILAREQRILDMLYSLIGLFRDGLFLKLSGPEDRLMYPDRQETAQILANHFTSRALRYIIDILMDRYEKKQNFPNYRNKLMVEGMLFEILEVKNQWLK